VGSDICDNFTDIKGSQFVQKLLNFSVSCKAFSDSGVETVNEFLNIIDKFLDVSDTKVTGFV